MKKTIQMLICAMVLGGFTVPAFSMMAFGMKGELAKGIDKFFEGAEPCFKWPISDPNATLIFSTRYNKEWNGWDTMAAALQKHGLATIADTDSLEYLKQQKQGVKLYVMQGRLGEVDARIFASGLQKKPIPLIAFALTEKGKDVFKQTSKPAIKRFGICSGGKFAVDEIRRWSEPATVEGKTVTEVVFTRKLVNLSTLYSELRQELAKLEDRGEWVITLYKTSDGWLALGNPTFRRASSK